MVAPAPTRSILRLSITTTPLTTSLPATSTLGTVKHTLNPVHTPTTTHNQVLLVLISTLYTLPSTIVHNNRSTKMLATPTLGKTPLTLPPAFTPSTTPTNKVAPAQTPYI